MRNKLELLIFDMDGVVLDSEPLHETARQMMYRKYGIGDIQGLPDPVGKSASEFWGLVIQAGGLQQNPQSLEDEQYALVGRQVRENHIPASAGLMQVLAWAKRNGIRIGLASSSSRSLVDPVLELLHIDPYFDCTVTGDEVTRKKPDPEVYLTILRREGISAGRTAAVEDSAAGVASAQGAGIFCYGYQNATSGEQDLSDANRLINRLDEIIEG